MASSGEARTAPPPPPAAVVPWAVARCSASFAEKEVARERTTAALLLMLLMPQVADRSAVTFGEWLGCRGERPTPAAVQPSGFLCVCMCVRGREEVQGRRGEHAMVSSSSSAASLSVTLQLWLSHRAPWREHREAGGRRGGGGREGDNREEHSEGRRSNEQSQKWIIQ